MTRSINDYSDEELGRMIKKASKGREKEAQEAMCSQKSFGKFLEKVGLVQLASFFVGVAETAWDFISDFLGDIF